MDNKMFCFQCQETAGGKGCTTKGVCGKSAAVAALQDYLVYETKVLSSITTQMRKENKKVEKSINHLITLNLFTTITNTNFHSAAIKTRIHATSYAKRRLLSEVEDVSSLPKTIAEKIDAKQIERKAQAVGILSTKDEDIRSLRELITYGLKGLSAYVKHANALGEEDKDIDAFIQSALAKTLDNSLSADNLISLALQTGEFGIYGMSLLDRANTDAYGNPEISKVNLGVRRNPGILVSGHDLRDLEMLLEQTKGRGVDVYTHSEMLPAHYYPAFKAYSHFVGNYGNAWWKQKEEFEKFNGPILMTTNCLVPPAESYKSRLWTTGTVGFPGCQHIYGKYGQTKDFSSIIAQAKLCPPPEEIESGEITGGFAHQKLSDLTGTIISAIKTGKIKKFVVMAGCDGRMRSREYYTEFAQHLPKDVVILTAGCAKYKYNKLDLGDIDGIPRVLDAGQCNDVYSLILTARALQDAFNLEDINDLPIIYNIAWYEQKAVLVLLSLLHLGIKNIHLGPSLPAFFSSNVTKVMEEKFGIAGISTVENDLNLFFGQPA